jgi:hypothetical protein
MLDQTLQIHEVKLLVANSLNSKANNDIEDDFYLLFCGKYLDSIQHEDIRDFCTISVMYRLRGGHKPDIVRGCCNICVIL